MAGENGGDCRFFAPTALLHAAHEGPTASKPRDALVSVCVQERKAQRERGQ